MAYAAVCVSALVFAPFFYIESASGNFETNMRHEQAVAVCQRVCEYVEANFRTATIAADFPLSTFLSIPQLGYVSDPPGRVVEASQLQLVEQASPVCSSISRLARRRRATLFDGAPAWRAAGSKTTASLLRFTS